MLRDLSYQIAINSREIRLRTGDPYCGSQGADDRICFPPNGIGRQMQKINHGIFKLGVFRQGAPCRCDDPVDALVGKRKAQHLEAHCTSTANQQQTQGTSLRPGWIHRRAVVGAHHWVRIPGIPQHFQAHCFLLTAASYGSTQAIHSDDNTGQFKSAFLDHASRIHCSHRFGLGIARIIAGCR
jgi:hypothetical protein